MGDRGLRRLEGGLPGPPKSALKLGTTQHDSSNQALGVLAAVGVNRICSTLTSARMDANSETTTSWWARVPSDRKIDTIRQMIRNAVKYNQTILGVGWSLARPQRRALQHVCRRESQGRPATDQTGRVDAETAWDSVVCFLPRSSKSQTERAEHARLKMALFAAFS